MEFNHIRVTSNWFLNQETVVLHFFFFGGGGVRIYYRPNNDS